VLLASNYRPKCTLRFYAYAAEEAGLLGSQRIVAATVAIQSNVVGVLQLDMTAYQGDPTDLWFYTDFTNAAQNQFLASLTAAYLPTLTVGYDRCGYGCSDHASWHNAGFMASFPFEASNANFNRALHTANDTTATFGNQADRAWQRWALISRNAPTPTWSPGKPPAPQARLRCHNPSLSRRQTASQARPVPAG
jgi:bacterial leucyl aminopeptidase